ncbi:MAG: hypothetical protein WC509_03670 [Candidatus Izemoplasmatales bacterium]
MKRLDRIGAAIFDYLLVAVLIAVSFFLVLPFLTVLTGAVAWFQASGDERDLALLFRSIRAHWKKSLPYGVALFLITGIAALDIAFFRQNAYPGSDLVLALSWIAVVLAFVTIVNGPTILNRMAVTLPQLVYDAFVLAIASPLDFLAAAAFHGVIVAAAILAPALAIPLSAPLLWIAARFSLHAFHRLESKQNPHNSGGKNV